MIRRLALWVLVSLSLLPVTAPVMAAGTTSKPKEYALSIRDKSEIVR